MLQGEGPRSNGGIVAVVPGGGTELTRILHLILVLDMDSYYVDEREGDERDGRSRYLEGVKVLSLLPERLALSLPLYLSIVM